MHVARHSMSRHNNNSNDENACGVLKTAGFRFSLSLKMKENLNTFTWVKGW
jgi:hypothetical protein